MKWSRIERGALGVIMNKRKLARPALRHCNRNELWLYGSQAAAEYAERKRITRILIGTLYSCLIGLGRVRVRVCGPEGDEIRVGFWI